MGFNTRTGAPAPNTTVQSRSFVSRPKQEVAVQETDIQVAPVEFDSMDGQHHVVSFEDVRNFICKDATPAECKIYLEVCKQYKANPFTREIYLIHYDNKDGDTPCTIVLGKTFYLKVAEGHPQYDGFEAGIIVLDSAAGEIDHRQGSLVYDGETLVGGWAKVYRKDRSRPYYSEVKLAEYDTGKSLWNGKKSTMIRKVAVNQALREAFPSLFGSLYDESEANIDVEASFRDVSEEQPEGRTSRRRIKSPKKEEPAPLVIENMVEAEGDPFANPEPGEADDGEDTGGDAE